MPKKKELTPIDIHSQIISTKAFKLKDGNSNNHQFIDLVSEFGVVPRAILIEKVRGKNNTLVVSAVNEEIWKLILKKAGRKDLLGKEGKNGKKEKGSTQSNSRGKRNSS